jgi:hypothetical protein
MHNKSLIFLSLMTLGLVGCNQNAGTNETAATTNNDQQQITQVQVDDNTAPAVDNQTTPAK